MHIALISPELTPFARTGELADYARSLAEALGALGQRVSVFVPYHQSAHAFEADAPEVVSGTTLVGAESVPWRLRRSQQAAQNVNYYLVQNDGYFDREGLYGDARGDYHDNCSRFLFFSRATLDAIEKLGDPVDLFHAHDWETGLVPAYLRCSFSERPFFSRAASVFTVHQINFLGQFWHWDWPLLNLPWKHFNWREMEFHGKICFLKAGLVYADLLTTVSPSYAKEIQHPDGGSGLEGLLRERSADLEGIVTGIDTQSWDPALDGKLSERFSVTDVSAKSRNRKALFRRCEWDDDQGRPIAALLGPLTERAGVVLVAQALDELVRREMRLVIVGTGDERCKTLFQRLHNLHPQRLSVFWTDDEELTRLALAASDLFLRPGLDSPSDATHLCAQRYGAVPVAHRTGILADTLVDGVPETLADGTASGFLFDEPTSRGLLSAIDRALKVRREQPQTWRAVQVSAMRQDFSWGRCARAYIDVFERAREKASTRAQ
jgi:starch synthase